MENKIKEELAMTILKHCACEPKMPFKSVFVLISLK